MTEMCKSNPCCGNYRNCKEPPQFKQREGWDAYKARTASPAETQGGDGVREGETLWCESCGESPVSVRLDVAGLCAACDKEQGE